MTKNKVKELVKIFDGNIDIALFYITWIKNGLNATKAYMELHPNIDAQSASVLGSRQLGKVSKLAIMEAYGLDHEIYFQQLKDGLKADKSDMTGQVFPDHKTRAIYHDKLGKLLGIESDRPQSLTQLNVEGGITYIIQTTDDKEEFNRLTSEPVKDIQKP